MIYISGKITGNADAEETFRAAEEYLKDRYHEPVINPFKVNAQLPKLEHAEYMHMSFAMLDLCNKVYFLSSWKDSCGASQEMGYAVAKKKILLFEEMPD